MPLIHLHQADNKDIFVPAHSILYVLGFPAGVNKPHPEATAVIRYNIGQGMVTSVFNDDAEQVIAVIMNDPKGRKDWLAFDGAEGQTSFVSARDIVAILGLDPDDEATSGMNSRVHFNVGGEAQFIDTNLQAADANESVQKALPNA